MIKRGVGVMENIIPGMVEGFNYPAPVRENRMD
jgi:hypothetical protein